MDISRVETTPLPFFLFFFEAGSLCDSDCLKLLIHLPQPPECWGYKRVSPQLAAFFFFFFFLAALEFELRASHLLSSILPLEPLHQPFLVRGLFKIGSLKLFARAGLKP
jgi:hypothetical protein